MLNVNGFGGAVKYHNRHGPLVETKEVHEQDWDELHDGVRAT